MIESKLPFSVPSGFYPRYGLACVLRNLQHNNLNLESEEPISVEQIGIAIQNIFADSQSHFRLRPGADPSIAEDIPFDYLPSTDLKNQSNLVQSSGLAKKGKYLAPSIIASDGTAKNTWKKVEGFRELCPTFEGIGDWQKNESLQRSYAPTVSKLNHRKANLSDPKGSRLEAYCSAITTVTPLKPSMYTSEGNVCIIPDLPLEKLLDFLEVFSRLTNVEAEKRLKSKRMNGGTEKKPNWGFRRPQIFNGNFPNAADQAIFGSLGLLASLGEWCKSAADYPQENIRKVISLLAGDADGKKSGCPLYIVSYNKISVEKYPNHITHLALTHTGLSSIIRGLVYRVVLRGELDAKSRYNNQSYNHFWFSAKRFLQYFSASTFRDFLAHRCEYPPELGPLFYEYFMNAKELKIPSPIVESARAYGQWINTQAYWAARTTVSKEEKPSKEDWKKIDKEKAKILNEMESAAMSADSAQDMLFRLSTRAGRLLGADAPPEASKFIVGGSNRG